MKQTEIGWIPEDWHQTEISDACQLINKKFNPLVSKNEKDCVELEHIESGSGRIKGTTSTRLTLSLKTVFSKGDILFGKLRPYLKKYALPNFDGVCTTEIWVIDSFANYKPFLFYIVQSDRFIEAANLSTGTKMPRAEWSTVSRLKIALPQMPEQRAIAEALSDADAWIESLETMLQKKRLIKQGAMQELLRPKEGWKVMKLGDLGDVKMCKRIFQNQTSEFGDIPFFKIGTFGKEPDAYITRTLFEDFKHRFSFPKKGEILISAAGTIGWLVVYDGSESYFQDSNIVWIDNSEEIISNSLLKYILPNVQYNTEGGTIQRLYNSILLNTQFNCPPVLEQARIATILSDMDAEIDTLEQRLAKARQIKQGMMQQLLTGQIRLVKPSLASAVQTKQRATV